MHMRARTRTVPMTAQYPFDVAHRLDKFAIIAAPRLLKPYVAIASVASVLNVVFMTTAMIYVL